jgi:membrane-bound lytic murein transglycosylase D
MSVHPEMRVFVRVQGAREPEKRSVLPAHEHSQATKQRRNRAKRPFLDGHWLGDTAGESAGHASDVLPVARGALWLPQAFRGSGVSGDRVVRRRSVLGVFSIILLFVVAGCSVSKVPPAWDDRVLQAVPSGSQRDVGAVGMPDDLLTLELPDPVQEVGEASSAPAHTDGFSGDRERKRQAGGQELLDAALELCEASQVHWSEGRMEEAVKALDEAYALILQVDTDDSPELVQQMEELRVTISKRILGFRASRFTAANGNHRAIPLTMNEYVQYEIARFQGPERNGFQEAYRRSGRYRDEIVRALRQAGLPEELSWLPLIESGFKVKAMSPGRALGLWQFIPSTGYKFGLKRDTWVDERMDPAKSTAAAIAYLKELHDIFGDWTTCLAAYNCGEGTILNLIRDQKTDYLDNFWDLYQMLPRETARYVPRFLATLHVLNDPAKYGISLDELETPPECVTATVDRQIHLEDAAEVLGVLYRDLIDLNPELRRRVTPNTTYTLRVPAPESEDVLARIADIPEWSPPDNAYIYHRVRKGESLSVIARKYGAGVRDIVMANNIRHKNRIRVGQKLKVPVGSKNRKAGVSTARSALPENQDVLARIADIPEWSPPDNAYIYHRVRKGESLSVIARKYGAGVRDIVMANNIRHKNRIRVGQKLKVPVGSENRKAGVSTARSALPPECSYEVKKGDSLFLIARKFNTNTKTLCQLNRLSSTRLQIGQMLRIAAPDGMESCRETKTCRTQ